MSVLRERDSESEVVVVVGGDVIRDGRGRFRWKEAATESGLGCIDRAHTEAPPLSVRSPADSTKDCEGHGSNCSMEHAQARDDPAVRGWGEGGAVART